MFEGIIDSLRLLFHKEKEPFLQLKSILGFMPHNLQIYRTALSHKSLVTKTKGIRRVNNERMEFLGDAVLESIVSDVLYRKYPNKQEGFLSTLRSRIVCRETLNDLAVKIGLDKLVLHSGSIGNAHNNYVNGNAFEAFCGAVYLDRGYTYCLRFIEDVIFRKFINIENLAKRKDNYKSKLIEWCQKYQLAVQFNLVSQTMLPGQNTPKFVSQVTIEGVYCGNGDGYSKKESQQNAACQAFRRVNRDAAFVNTLIEARSRHRQTAAAD